MKTTITLFLLLITLPLFSQQFIYGANNYTEYHIGTLPIVISVPHGGNLTPADIPDRTCNNPTLVQDANTIALGRQIDSSLYNLTGCHPHLIYCNLHRKKLDCNRNLADGACGNAAAITAWNEFFNFIDTAQQIAQEAYDGDIFYIDLHGHGNPIQRIELGYLLYDDELELPDSVLNTPQYIGYSSIQNLVGDNVQNLTHSQLLKGEQALGTLLGNKGYPAVPSQQIPFPGTSSNYFSGGYNIAQHTSYQSSSIVNGVQMECNYDGVRDSYTSRKNFADSLALVLSDFLQLHRNVEILACGATEVNDVFENKKETIFPNPIKKGQNLWTISGIQENNCPYALYTVDGQLIASGKLNGDQLLLPYNLNYGMYLLEINLVDKKLSFKVVVA